MIYEDNENLAQQYPATAASLKNIRNQLLVRLRIARYAFVIE
jgi:hypothetical protein